MFMTRKTIYSSRLKFFFVWKCVKINYFIKTCFVKIRVDWQFFRSQFISLLESLQKVIDRSRMMVSNFAEQLTKVYIRQCIKTVQNKITFSNFYLQNSSNSDAAIQIFLRLHKPNSTVFHPYVTFCLKVAQAIFVL